MSDDPVAFLKARYDEDEELARQALETGTAPMWDPASNVFLMPGLRNRRRLAAQGVEGALDGAVEAHIARHDPARALREIDAKREQLKLHGIVHREIGWLENGDEESGEIPVCGLCVPKHSHYQRREDVPEGPCLTVRLLAAPYDDHPDYREEWRP
jgi:hypothetical protein